MELKAQNGSADEVVGKDKNNEKCPSFVCCSCNFTTKHRFSLLRHKRTHKEPMFSCARCPKIKFHTKYDLKHHEDRAHGDRLLCPHCTKTFITKTGLSNHLKMARGEFRYKCDICSKVFISKTHYEGHMNIHRGYKPFTCITCNQLFAFKSSLTRHQETCTQSEPDRLVCNECNNSFFSRDSLRAHKRGKHSNKIYRCEVCGKSYNWSASYYRHVKSHQ